MSCYVDLPDKPYGRMLMCHMIADSQQELLSWAARLGVQQKWIQKKGEPNEHLDICKSKRDLALKLGAVELTNRELARKVMERRKIAR